MEQSRANAFARRCATVSWLAPVVAWLCVYVIGLKIGEEGGSLRRLISFAVIVVMVLLPLMGLVCGVMTLIICRGSANPTPRPQAIVGVAISSLLILGVVSGFQKSNDHRNAVRNSLAKIKDIETEFRISSTNDLNDVERGNKKLEQLQGAIDSAATNLTGENALTAKAFSSYLSELNRRKQEYNAATAEVKTAKPTSPYGVTNLAQLDARSDVVRTFLKKNGELESFIEHAPEHFEEELDKLNVLPETKQKRMQGFHKEADKINPIVLQIRKEDDMLGEAILGMLKVEHDHWGHWKMPSENAKITFSEPGVAQEFNRYLKQYKDAGQRGAELQSQLVETSKAAK